MSMHIACSGFCSEQRELNYRNNIEELNTNDSKKFQRQTKPVYDKIKFSNDKKMNFIFLKRVFCGVIMEV